MGVVTEEREREGGNVRRPLIFGRRGFFFLIIGICFYFYFFVLTVKREFGVGV